MVNSNKEKYSQKVNINYKMKDGEYMSNKIIEVQNIKIGVTNVDERDYICISDIAKVKSSNSRAADVIRNWLRNRSTLDFLTTWEQIYNPNFKVFESEHFRKQVDY